MAWPRGWEQGSTGEGDPGLRGGAAHRGLISLPHERTGEARGRGCRHRGGCPVLGCMNPSRLDRPLARPLRALRRHTTPGYDVQVRWKRRAQGLAPRWPVRSRVKEPGARGAEVEPIERKLVTAAECGARGGFHSIRSSAHLRSRARNFPLLEQLHVRNRMLVSLRVGGGELGNLKT
jgi:hypothetical protein